MRSISFNSLLILVIPIMFFSCTSSTATETTATASLEKPVNIDSLSAAWDDAWNSKNKQGVIDLLADSAIAFEDGWMVTGKDSLVEKFVTPNISVTKSFNTTTIKDDVSEGMAYTVGIYTMEGYRKDSTVNTHKGPYTLIWKKQTDNNWKVVVMQTGTIK